jgi:nuclear transport factor 2 (NTF2) superfamily protein
MLLLMLITTFAEAAPNSNDPVRSRKEAAAMTPAERDARVATIIKRVEEIRAMDRSKLSREERKELKKELRALNKEAKIFGRGGIYLSVGAILVIILVLILIL